VGARGRLRGFIWCNATLGVSGKAMEPRELEVRLHNLLTEHRDLDSAIDALIQGASSDQVQIARLKKRKLRLKDEIAMVHDQLVPDIIA
jgi:hypothetical protein